MTDIQRVDWHGCYDGSWQSAPLVPEAFAHPAKVPFALAERIYRFMLAEGWLSAGDQIMDPFGGIGGCGFHAMLYGMDWTGVELEQRFVDLANGYECSEAHPCPDCKPAFDELARCRRAAEEAKAGLENTYLMEEMAYWEKARAEAQAKLDALVAEACGKHRAGNLEIWRARYAPHFPGYGTGRLVQGDSRRLRQVIREADGVVSSPPYSETSVAKSSTGVNLEKQYATYRAQGGGASFEKFAATQAKHSGDYGVTAGQLGTMPAGDHFAAVVSSPPYAEARIDGNGDEGASGLRAEDGSYLRGPAGWEQRKAMGARYGQSAGNLGNLPAGAPVDGIVSSPPYADGSVPPNIQSADASRLSRNEGDGQAYGSTLGQLGAMPAGAPVDGIVSSPPYSDGAQHTGGETRMTSGQGGPIKFVDYGTTEGQLGAMPAGEPADGIVSSPPYEHKTVHGQAGVTAEGFTEPGRVGKTSAAWLMDDYGSAPDNLGNNQGETFWSAARTIVEECFAILKPGGYAAWITGDYVRNKQRVPFGEQWLALCEAVGFEPVLWAVAWKAETHGHQLDIFGQPVELKTSRVSFFRRLSNRKNPDAAIENEDVIFVRKPL